MHTVLTHQQRGPNYDILVFDSHHSAGMFLELHIVRNTNGALTAWWQRDLQFFGHVRTGKG